MYSCEVELSEDTHCGIQHAGVEVPARPLILVGWGCLHRVRQRGRAGLPRFWDTVNSTR